MCKLIICALAPHVCIGVRHTGRYTFSGNPGARMKHLIHRVRRLLVFSPVLNSAELLAQVRLVCPSVHMKQLENCLTDFHEIWCWTVSRKKLPNHFNFNFNRNVFNDIARRLNVYLFAHLTKYTPGRKCFQQNLQKKIVILCTVDLGYLVYNTIIVFY